MKRRPLASNPGTILDRYTDLTDPTAGELFAVRRDVEFGPGTGDIRPACLLEWSTPLYSCALKPQEWNAFEYWADRADAVRACAEENAVQYGVEVRHSVVQLKDVRFDAWVYDHYFSRPRFLAVNATLQEGFAAGLEALGISAMTRTYLMAGFAMHGAHTHQEKARELYPSASGRVS